ncbi:DUF6252 family protein [Mariniflexile soesokkakense]|uniref:DUF6252 family protein n=1 Tax=Mariniflexile soesokkakense TaxID=1343160 RepID=A0ABV0AF25_9FLAO
MNKVTFKSIFIFSILAIIIFSCNIEPYEGEIPDAISNKNQGVFKVDFDGLTYEADNIQATLLNDVFNITGFRGNSGEALTLTVFNPSLGKHALGVTNNSLETNAAAYTEANNTGSGSWVAFSQANVSQGEINITGINEIDKTISGTFYFTGTNASISKAKEFTKGVFTNVSFEASLGGGNTNNNTFFAKVDGVEFKENLIAGIFQTLNGVSTIGISATKDNLQTIGFNLDGNILPGEYTFNTFSTPMALYNRSMSDINTGTGILKISTHDKAKKRIIGTFQFTASPFLSTGASYEITEGSFDVTYF